MFLKEIKFYSFFKRERERRGRKINVFFFLFFSGFLRKEGRESERNKITAHVSLTFVL